MSKSKIQEQIMDIKTWVEQNLCHGHNKHHPVCQRLTKLYKELEGCVCVPQEFQSWLEERERKSKAEFLAKGWGNTKLEITVVKEKFLELTEQREK